jgi:hypothetical protein
MKKILMTLAAVCFAATMNAQVYVGGSLSINSWNAQKNAGDRSETTFKIMPEIGYNINENWAIGTVIGYESNKWTGVQNLSESAFTISPYARYTFAKLGKVNFFVDGGFGYTTAKDADWNEFAVGVKPGLAVALSDKVSFVSHIGFLGYDVFNPDGDDNNISKFGLNLDSSNLSFGLYFNF